MRCIDVEEENEEEEEDNVQEAEEQERTRSTINLYYAFCEDPAPLAIRRCRRKQN